MLKLHPTQKIASAEVDEEVLLQHQHSPKNSSQDHWTGLIMLRLSVFNRLFLT